MLIRNIQKLSFLLVTCLSLIMLSACDFSGGSAESHMQKAREFLEAENSEAAALELKNALKKDNNLPEARWLLGNIYLQQGNGTAARKELNEARTLGYSDPEMDKLLLKAMLLEGKNQDILDLTFTEGDMEIDTLLIRGDAQVNLEQFDEARATFNEALAKDSSSVAARRGLIRVALQKRELDEAAALIEETLGLAVEDANVWALKGQLAFLSNDPGEAEKAFEKAVLYGGTDSAAQFGLARALIIQQKYEKARGVIDEVATHYPKHPLVKYYRGFFALQQDDLDTAKTLLQDVIRVLPNHAESLLMLSRIHYDQNELEQAKTYITDFLAIYPRHVPAMKILSAIQLRQKQPGLTVELLSDAATNARGDWQVLALLGSALMESGDMEKGIEILEQAAEINPDTAAIRTQLAIGHMASGANESAIAELESAIQLDPKMVRADILLVLANLKSEKFDAAINAARAITEKQPDNPLSYNLLGAAYLSSEDPVNARKEFDKALELNPDFTPAIANIGRIEIQNKNLDAAKKSFMRILDIDDKNATALLNLAFIANEEGESQQSLDFLERARKANPTNLEARLLLGRYHVENRNFTQLLEVTGEANNIAPSHPEVMLLYGQAQRYNGKNEDALDILGRLAQQLPEEKEVLLQLAFSQLQAGKTPEAEANLEKVLAKDPVNGRALSTLARIAIANRDFDVARQRIDSIAELPNGKSEALVLEGDLFNLQENFDAAIKSYREALEVLPNSAIVSKIAQTQERAGDRDGAVATLKDWLKTHPDDPGANLYLAEFDQRDKRTGEAINRYEKVLESNPDSVIALNNLAIAYLDSQPDRAVTLAKRANELVPDSPEIMDTLGWILVQQKNVEEGLAFLTPARELGGHIPGIRYHYAAALHAAGDSKRAKSELTSLLEEHESFPERTDAEKLLKDLNK